MPTASLTEGPLLYTVEEHIGIITINRPEKRNALDPETIERFVEALELAAADADVTAVLIQGAGDKAFCAGADLSTVQTDGAGGVPSYATLLKRLAAFPKPTVARVQGYCLAGGMGVMLACDLVYASSSATFGTPEVNVGLFPFMIGALILRDIPRKKALEMVYLGERFTAAEALEMELVTKVVPDAHLEHVVAELLDKLRGKSPLGLRMGKSAFVHMAGMDFETAVHFLSDQLAELSKSDDAKEGLAAFREKRQPHFKGT